MIRLLRLEIRKLIAKPRTYISPGLLILLVALVFWALKKDGTKVLDFVFQTMEQHFVIEGEILTGAFATYLVLNSLWIHIPVLMVIVTGDLLGSELESGTVRLMLSRPIRRSHFLASKILVSLVFSCYLIGVLFLFAYLPANLLFGNGDLVVFLDGLQVISSDQLPKRFLGAFAFSALGMGSFGILSVCLSVFTRQSLSAILISLGVLVLSTLIQTLGPTLFPGWQNFLLTFHLSQWQLFFQDPINWTQILISSGWLLGFMLLCFWISLKKFQRLNLTE